MSPVRALAGLTLLALAPPTILTGGLVRIWATHWEADLLHAAAAFCTQTATSIQSVGHATLTGGRPLLLTLAILLTAGIVTGGAAVLATRRRNHPLASGRQPLPPDAVEIARKLRILDRVRVAADDRPFAICHGVLRPEICISTGLLTLLDRDELAAVLAHEAYHLRSRDPLKGALAAALSGLAFPLPAARALRARYVDARELAADRAAVAFAGRDALLRALIHVARGWDGTAAPGLPRGSDAPAPAIASGSPGLRIQQLCGEDPAPPRVETRSALATFAALALTLGLAVSATPPAPELHGSHPDCGTPAAAYVVPGP